jgi:hypothetical protein
MSRHASADTLFAHLNEMPGARVAFFRDRNTKQEHGFQMDSL